LLLGLSNALYVARAADSIVYKNAFGFEWGDNDESLNFNK
jgi:hypothetical protein